MALDVESLVHGGVGSEEFLREAGALETLHLALSGRLMRNLGPIVLPSPVVMQVMPRAMRCVGYSRAWCNVASPTAW